MSDKVIDGLIIQDRSRRYLPRDGESIFVVYDLTPEGAARLDVGVYREWDNVVTIIHNRYPVPWRRVARWAAIGRTDDDAPNKPTTEIR